MINKDGGEGIDIHADVSKSDECKTLVDKAVANYSQLDFACNNAGIGGEIKSNCTNVRRWLGQNNRD